MQQVCAETGGFADSPSEDLNRTVGSFPILLQWNTNTAIILS